MYKTPNIKQQQNQTSKKQTINKHQTSMHVFVVCCSCVNNKNNNNIVIIINN